MSGLFQDDPAPQDDAPPVPDGPGLFPDAAPAAEPVHATPYRVLARKYRPTRFDDLIGQEAMVRILRNAFAISRVAHAFMLTGVRGVGKTTTARIIARALNCIGADGSGSPTADPCGVCDNCLAILADRHPDVIEMDAASRTGVGDMRELIEATRFRPMQARTKVFIVDEVHMLSTSAFNALLKTLEEPPPHVKFVFATTELRKVPITVLSRCQRFDLRRVQVAELARHYGRIAGQEGVAIEPAALDQIARAADGSVRDGLSILDQAIAQAEGGITAAQVADMLGLADRELVFDLLDAVMGGRPAAALAITESAYARGADLGTMLQDLLELLHTLTRLKSIPALRDSADLPEAERTRGAELADRLSVPVLARAWQMLLKGIGEVETAPDRRAAAEMVLIRLCHVADMPTPSELVRRLTGSAAVPGPQSAERGAAPAAAMAASIGTDPGAVASEHGVPLAQQPVGAAPAPRMDGSLTPGVGGTRSAATASPGWGGTSGSAPARVDSPGLETGHPASPAFGALAVAGGGALAPEAAPEAAPPPLRLSSFRDVAQLVSTRKEAMLHAHLLHSVHLVRFAPPIIELRPQPEAPRDLAPKLAALLTEATGTRWTIAMSTVAGDPTLAEQGNAADTARRSAAAEHPLVKAILQAFPGARIDTVHDRTTDAYGLPAAAAAQPDFSVADPDITDPDITDPDMPDFAPPDAAYFDEDPMEIDP